MTLTVYISLILIRRFRTLSSDKEVEATLKIFGKEFSISQTPYEICGYIFKNSELIPTKITGEY